MSDTVDSANRSLIKQKISTRKAVEYYNILRVAPIVLYLIY